MKLAEWIRREGLSRSAVAERLGVSPAYVTNLCSETPHWPGREVMSAIREVTGGEVAADDFLPPFAVAGGDNGVREAV